jgi:hypothetical protein
MARPCVKIPNIDKQSSLLIKLVSSTQKLKLGSRPFPGNEVFLKFDTLLFRHRGLYYKTFTAAINSVT